MITITLVLSIACGALLLASLYLWRCAGALQDRIQADEAWLRSMNLRLQAVEVRGVSLDTRVRALEAQGVSR